MSTQNELNQNLSMDDLLDGTLDDLADAPEFKPFAAGAYTLKLNFKETKVNDIPSVEVKLTVVEVAELSNPDDTPPAKGDTTNILYMFQKVDKDTGKKVRNELGEGQFKEILASLKPAFPEVKTNRELMAAAEGYEVLGVTSVRTNKKDPKDVKYYTALDSVSII